MIGQDGARGHNGVKVGKGGRHRSEILETSNLCLGLLVSSKMMKVEGTLLDIMLP